MFFPILGSRFLHAQGHQDQRPPERRWVTGWESVPAILGIVAGGPWAFPLSPHVCP